MFRAHFAPLCGSIQRCVLPLTCTSWAPPAVLLFPCAGAGKSSLLAALSGKAAAYGVVSGTTLVNGRSDRLERYKSLMGFVPQARCRGGADLGVPPALLRRRHGWLVPSPPPHPPFPPSLHARRTT